MRPLPHGITDLLPCSIFPEHSPTASTIELTFKKMFIINLLSPPLNVRFRRTGTCVDFAHWSSLGNQNSACHIVGTQPVECICMVYWFHVSYFTGRQSWDSLCLHCILLKNWTLSPSIITLLCFNLHPCFAASLSHFNLILHITGFSDMTDLLRHDRSLSKGP